MWSILASMHDSILQQDHFNLLLFSGIISSIGIILIFYAPYLRCKFRRFIQTQLHKLILKQYVQPGDKDAFISYYRNSLCNQQEVNNDQLKIILKKTSSSPFLHSAFNVEDPLFVEVFRQIFPLTTYENYRDYIDRIVNHGEKNVLCSDKIIYFATSSGTTGKIKLLPVTIAMLKRTTMLIRLAQIAVWRSFPESLFPAAHQRFFNLQTGKRSNMFMKSKDGTPIGPLSQVMSAVSLLPVAKTLVSSNNVIDISLIENISDFETTVFVQLVFALTIPDIFYYSVTFAPGCLHTIKLIENHFEEMCLCISSIDFCHSSLVRKNIHDVKFRTLLNRALENTTLEYGGVSYRSERVNHIRRECLKVNTPGLLHRLWPRLVFVSTTISDAFFMYKKEIKFYCGEKLSLINFSAYGASESFFGSLASIHTAEYILSPKAAFFEFIKEEDIYQAQPKTLLLSQITPGHRYELVCTTDSGLIRYRMGDVITCTRYLTEADDAVPLPFNKSEIPKVPLISISYRTGNLLSISGENTTEQHVLNALEETVQILKQQGIHIEISDFTVYPKLDAFPARYVMFLELITQDVQLDISSEIERQLCETNRIYKDHRDGGKLGPIMCILVRSGTFSIFLNKILVSTSVSSVQIKPHRLLKNEEHILFFHDARLISND